MSSAALLTFLVVAGIVWGGFVLVLTTAIRRENRKPREG